MLVLDALSYQHVGQPGYSFTLSAPRGEITAVSGPSGSGKSTLLDMIAGFLPPMSGRLTFEDVDLLPLPPEQRPVSILFQSDNLFDHLSARKNLALALPSRMPRGEVEAAVEKVLADVGLPGIGQQQAATLSGGQKQRVALARTLLRDRPILLLDEPFSALDDEARADARALVSSLTERQRWATVLVSHQAEDVAALATNRYTIEDGRLLLGG